MVAQTLLATLPGMGPEQRLQVTLRQCADGSLVIELREQHYGGEAVGWFDQRTMSLAPCQWKQLQTVLGSKNTAPLLAAEADACPATIPFPGRRVEPPCPHRPAVGDGA